jgi:hypothetical protein
MVWEILWDLGVSHGFWVCLVFFLGWFRVFGGSWGSLLVWGAFGAGLGVRRGIHCFLGFGFLVGFARVRSVLRLLFLVYSVCTRSALRYYL